LNSSARVCCFPSEFCFTTPDKMVVFCNGGRCYDHNQFSVSDWRFSHVYLNQCYDPIFS
jgi:hypothetical protein